MSRPTFLINFNPNEDDRSNRRWAMWKLLAKSFEFDLAIYTLGLPLIKRPVPPALTFTNIPEAQRRLPVSEWVFMVAPTMLPSLPRQSLMDEPPHLDGAVYVMGPEYEDWDITDCQIDRALQVDTPGGTGELHTITAAAIVAYDYWRHHDSHLRRTR